MLWGNGVSAWVWDMAFEIIQMLGAEKTKSHCGESDRVQSLIVEYGREDVYLPARLLTLDTVSNCCVVEFQRGTL